MHRPLGQGPLLHCPKAAIGWRMSELRTERLVLRRATMHDLHAMHAVLSDAAAMTYWSTAPHTGLAQTRDWLTSMCDAPPSDSDDFVVTRKGELIGKLGAWRLPEIGFILRSDHWGKGYAAEAMSAFLPHVFGRSDVAEITADVDPRNAASLKLLQRFGFSETGRASGTWRTHQGLCDSIYLRLARDAWLKRAS